MLRSEAIRVAFALFVGGLICLGLPYDSLAQDPGVQDSMIVGNLNRTPMVVGLNSHITVPIYIRTDDSVTFMHFPLATDDDYIASRDTVIFFPPLSLWDDISYLASNPNSPVPGYTNQSILGFAFLILPRDPQNFLMTNGQWVHIADYHMTTTGDIDILGDTTHFVEGINPQNGDLNFGLQDGTTEFRPAVVWGALYFPPNNPPSFTSPSPGTYPVNEQFGATFIVTANDPDTDSMVLTVTFGTSDYTFTQLQNVPGHISFLFNWVPGPGSFGTFPLTFTVNDGNGGIIDVELILEVSPAELSMDDISAMPGAAISLPVSLDNQGSSSAVGAFEILVNWNPEALTLNGVTRAGRLGSFEYFYVNNDDGGPGTARITGIADIRNGLVSPPLHPGTGPIFYLEMSLAADENLIGVHLPVTFLNLDQTDNTLSDSTGYLLVHPELDDGIISVIGPEDILTGDINLNGIPCEGGDVVLFVNHLTNPGLFPFNSVQLEASDVNADGLPETVADLVYLINIFNGRIERPKIEEGVGMFALMMVQGPNGVEFTAQSTVMPGAALMKISHAPGLTLTPVSTGPFTLAFNDDGVVLTVLAYLPNSDEVPPGTCNLFNIPGHNGELAVTELSASSAFGFLVNTTIVPSDYELSQNYPNPFNATTRISFGLPEATHVRLDIFSITGQMVCTLVDEDMLAGSYSKEWDGRDSGGRSLSSGVYFYRLNTGDQDRSMKMTLLK